MEESELLIENGGMDLDLADSQSFQDSTLGTLYLAHSLDCMLYTLLLTFQFSIQMSPQSSFP